MADIAEHARANRRSPTEGEIRLWRRLSNRQLGDLKFRRQHAVGDRILDFFCPALNLGLEVDGDTHSPGFDHLRDSKLKKDHGITIIRFSNVDVMTNMEGVLLTILADARMMPPRWSLTDSLHPNPSSEEEGL